MRGFGKGTRDGLRLRGSKRPRVCRANLSESVAEFTHNLLAATFTLVGPLQDAGQGLAASSAQYRVEY